MAVAFLLDEHISPLVARGVARAGYDAEAVAGSPIAKSDDDAVLRSAIATGRILVTYNSGDFAALVVDAVKAGIDIPGVVFVDHRTIPSSDIGGLVKSLGRLAAAIERGDVNPAMGIWLTRG